jgi:hypothetical protein
MAGSAIAPTGIISAAAVMVVFLTKSLRFIIVGIKVFFSSLFKASPPHDRGCAGIAAAEVYYSLSLIANPSTPVKKGQSHKAGLKLFFADFYFAKV